MSSVLPTGPLFGAFLIASVVLAVIPGPGVIYIVTRSLAQGRSSGMASVIGVALGNFGNALAAALGLGALLAISTTAFLVLKYAGAAYLVYLGVRAFLAPKAHSSPAVSQDVDATRIFRDGFVVALLNPKTTVFFAAFLPQFMSAHASPMLQSMMLGTLFVVIAALTDTVYAVSASALAPILTRRGTRSDGRALTGSVYLGLGVFAALSDSRSVK